MTDTRAFNVGAILTVIGGPFMCDIGEIYGLLGWMTGEDLMTHQLPRASRECEGFLRATFPDLTAIEIPAWTEMSGWTTTASGG
jgi:hypothetical protein